MIFLLLTKTKNPFEQIVPICHEKSVSRYVELSKYRNLFFQPKMQLIIYLSLINDGVWYRLYDMHFDTKSINGLNLPN